MNVIIFYKFLVNVVWEPYTFVIIGTNLEKKLKLNFFLIFSRMLISEVSQQLSEYSGNLGTLCLEAPMNHHNGVSSIVLLQSDSFKTCRIWGILDEPGKKS